MSHEGCLSEVGIRLPFPRTPLSRVCSTSSASHQPTLPRLLSTYAVKLDAVVLDQPEVVHEEAQTPFIDGRTVDVRDETLHHQTQGHGLGDDL